MCNFKLNSKISLPLSQKLHMIIRSMIHYVTFRQKFSFSEHHIVTNTEICKYKYNYRNIVINTEIRTLHGMELMLPVLN